MLKLSPLKAAITHPRVKHCKATGGHTMVDMQATEAEAGQQSSVLLLSQIPKSHFGNCSCRTPSCTKQPSREEGIIQTA